MSDVKLLNLDDLAVVKRVVTFKGKEYEVANQTLGQMLTRMELAKKAKDDGEGELTPENIVKQLYQTAADLLPDAPDSVIRSLNSEQILALIDFVNEKDADLQKEAEAAEQEDGERSEKKS